RALRRDVAAQLRAVACAVNDSSRPASDGGKAKRGPWRAPWRDGREARHRLATPWSGTPARVRFPLPPPPSGKARHGRLAERQGTRLESEGLVERSAGFLTRTSAPRMGTLAHRPCLFGYPRNASPAIGRSERDTGRIVGYRSRIETRLTRRCARI